MNLTLLAAIALGGALGSLARYFVATALQPPTWTGFPYAIFIVNVSGSMLMGIVTELSARKLHLPTELRAFMTVGIIGGYTTFSTFSLESALLIERGAYASAALYMAGSAVLSVLALFAGLWMVRAI